MKKYGVIFLAAVFGGAMIGMGGAIYLRVENPIVGALFFALGLFTILNYRMALFTGRIGYLFFEKKIALELVVIWLGNLAGAFLAARLISLTRVFPTMDAVNAMVDAKLSDSLLSVFVLSLFCGILMFLAVNSFKKVESALFRAILVFLSVAVFILCGFEHCVANMFYFSLASAWSWKTLYVLLVMTAGNAVGALLLSAFYHCNEKRS